MDTLQLKYFSSLPWMKCLGDGFAIIIQVLVAFLTNFSIIFLFLQIGSSPYNIELFLEELVADERLGRFYFILFMHCLKGFSIVGMLKLNINFSKSKNLKDLKDFVSN